MEENNVNTCNIYSDAELGKVPCVRKNETE